MILHIFFALFRSTQNEKTMNTHPELREPLSNLERLAGRVSRITDAKIEIVQESSPNAESYYFLLPNNVLLHVQLVELFEAITTTVKNKESGLFLLQTNGRTQIHTFVRYHNKQ